jgi:hypothetical protein
MNIFRCMGVFAVVAGVVTLVLTCMPATQASTELSQAIAEQFRGSALLHFLGGIAAIVSGSYLFTAVAGD